MVQTTPSAFVNNAPTRAGQSFHGDHLYAFYQIPEHARSLRSSCSMAPYRSSRTCVLIRDGNGRRDEIGP
jgi:hypothetical protein